MELQELKNRMSSGSFIVGHKIRVKTREEIDEVDKDEELKYKKFDYYFYEKYVGKEFISSIFEYNRLKFYQDPNQDWRFRDTCIDLKYLDFTNDNRQPSEESIALAKECVLLNKYIFMSTRGECHGDSKSALMTSENVYPVLDIDGNSVIRFPVSGYGHGCLTLDIVKSLINNDKIDQGINTGMSYIARDLVFYTEDEVKKKSFKY